MGNPNLQPKSESVSLLFVSDSLRPPETVACQVPLSMEFSRPRILELVATPFFRASSLRKDQTGSSASQRDSLPSASPGKTQLVTKSDINVSNLRTSTCDCRLKRGHSCRTEPLPGGSHVNSRQAVSKLIEFQDKCERIVWCRINPHIWYQKSCEFKQRQKEKFSCQCTNIVLIIKKMATQRWQNI